MADDLIFYTNPMSRGQIVRWMLEEVGAPYTTHILGYGTSMKEAAYLAINRMCKVPAIVHDGKIVTECAAICAYLADAFPAAGLAPAAADRADYYRWMFFAAGPVEQAITAKHFGIEPDADQQRMAGFGSLGAALDALEGAVAGRTHVADDRFTAADVYVGSQVMWGTQFGTLPKRDSFMAYADRLAARPANQTASAKDDAATPAAQV